jgi:hypothetical protein
MHRLNRGRLASLYFYPPRFFTTPYTLRISITSIINLRVEKTVFLRNYLIENILKFAVPEG